MKSLPRLFAAFVFPLFVLCVLAGCSGPVSPSGKTLSSIAVTPATPAALKIGATQQFTATGTYSDSSTADITSTVTWNSGTPATATISATGLATAVGAGTTQITASLSGVTSSPVVTLTVVSLTSIAVTPNPAAVVVSGTLQLTATGTYSDASTANISSQVTWACTPGSVATISAAGLVTAGAANGTCQITATLGTIVSPAVTLTVGTGGTPVPVAVKIQQLNPTIRIGGAEDFTTKFLFSDGSLQAPTAAVTWTSGTTATATILPTTGIASGLAPGTSMITAASTGLTSDNTMLTVVPAIPRFAFATGNNDVAPASYVVNSANNTLTPSSIVRDSTKPAQIVLSPNGTYAYGPGANSVGTIALYTVDPTSGALTFSSALNSGVASIAPFQSIMDPTGRFLYVVDSNGNLVGLATDTTNFDGSLTPLTGSPYGVGNFPVGVAEDPAGKYVYVTNNGDGNISGFKTNADGSLTSLGAAVSSGSGAGSGPGFPAIDQAGTFLYVPNTADGTISVFSINSATGAIAKVGADVSTGVGTSPFMIVLCQNKFLYVTDQNNNAVIGFTIGAGGALTGLTTTPTGNFPQGLAIDVNGSFLVVANNSDDTLTYYGINGTTGALTVGRTVQTRSLPFFVTIGAGTAAPIVAATTVEAANTGNGAGTGSISSYTVNSSSGALTTAASSPASSLDGNNQAYASLSGKFFYTASATGKKAEGFSLDVTTAALTALPGSPNDISPSVAGGIYAEPSDLYVFVADTATPSILSLNNDPVSGLTTNSSLTAGLTSVNAIAGDNQGILIYALGANVLQPLLIDISGATILPGASTALAQAGNWTAGAIDPSGHFLVAADSTGHQISSFAIQPVAGTANPSCAPIPPFTPPADGCLTLVPSSTISVGTGLNGPYALTFDPLGRFLFVADQATGNVAVFSFDPSTGLTAAVGSPVAVDASGVTNVAVDANGKFLYVGTKGNGTTVAGKVAVYTIGSTGTLTAGTPVNAGIGNSAVTVTNSIF